VLWLSHAPSRTRTSLWAQPLYSLFEDVRENIAFGELYRNIILSHRVERNAVQAKSQVLSVA